jgi:branched-subunit amino acid aminotransferase/4-amino-4-deoxychorismate lyase
MIGVFDPPAPLGQCRAMPVTYLREAPHLKHVATMGLIRARRAAVQAGFDDALFTDAEGRILEGTLWNVGFVRGDEVVWPEGPKLQGVAQALIQRNLGAVGMSSRHAVVRLADLPTFDHAFLCNSATPAAALTAIGEHRFDPAPDVVARIAAAWSAALPEKI